MSTPPPGRTLLIPVEDTEVREETRAARWHQLFARSRCLLPLSRPTQTQTLQKFQACVSALKWTLAHVYRGGRERTERERERDEETRAESGARPTQGAEKKDAGPQPPNLPPLPTRPTRPPARPDRQPGRPGAPRRTQQQAPRGDPSGPTSLILSPSPHPFPGDTLLFLTIIPDPPRPTACAFGPPAGPPALEAGLHLDGARSALTARFTPLADAAGAPYHVAILTSPDASCEAVGALICERAAGAGAALVAMAAHNKGALARACLGSTTQHCVDHSPATVLVMREGVAAGCGSGGRGGGGR